MTRYYLPALADPGSARAESYAERCAEEDQQNLWCKHQDDLIGVPEVEVWNGALIAAVLS